MGHASRACNQGRAEPWVAAVANSLQIRVRARGKCCGSRIRIDDGCSGKVRNSYARRLFISGRGFACMIRRRKDPRRAHSLDSLGGALAERQVPSPTVPGRRYRFATRQQDMDESLFLQSRGSCSTLDGEALKLAPLLCQKRFLEMGIHWKQQSDRYPKLLSLYVRTTWTMVPIPVTVWFAAYPHTHF
ncbi:hypothetical protein F1559_003693 [Cyanidiococcus yangmingshanensis]|uniref:Uncharacterized protein n=1 Tax=Cyanidiococcus yangmingshanensis TaxID=2690220 RepID=A0A7J7IFL7_9RHOD|nr:hypothetical protein F1559_003693 [Cyanidiococcus yangmingshanensis]